MMRAATQPEIETPPKYVPPALRRTPPLATNPKPPKQVKLIKDKKDKAD